MARTVIIGAPRAGKTTRALALGGEIVHTDDFAVRGDFSAQSEAAAAKLGGPGDWTMEGVTAVRALRKWMQAHPGKPCDQVVRLTEPHEPLTPGQASLAKGCDTVFREIEPELRKRGVVIE